MIDRSFDHITINRTIKGTNDHSFDHITINQTNSLGSIDHLIISQSIELIC
jgi:hypothetical protein